MVMSVTPSVTSSSVPPMVTSAPPKVASVHVLSMVTSVMAPCSTSVFDDSGIFLEGK